MAGFAEALDGRLGVRPPIAGVGPHFDLLLGPAAPVRLTIVDDFSRLLEVSRDAAADLAAALDRRDPGSSTRLVIAGSQVAVMEGLLAPGSPLHGRATSLRLAPRRFGEARGFLAGLDTEDLVVRYAVAGGRPLHLSRIGRPWSLRTALCEDVLNPLGPFFD
jgi:hypothetical protein